MFPWILSFFSGVFLSQQLKTLPALYWIFFIFFTAFIINIFFSKKIFFLKLFSATLFGFSWALLYASFILSWNLPTPLEGKIIPIEGTISSLPVTTSYNTSFLFSLKKI